MVISVKKKNEAYLIVDADDSIKQEICDFFTFEIPGARYMPSYKAKAWDGKMRLYSLAKRELYVGLLGHLKEFAKRAGYDIDIDVAPVGEKYSAEDLNAFVESLNLHSQGKPIEIRDYQKEAVLQAINHGRKLLLSPTASGKSLILYTLVRYHQLHNRKQLIIVPTTSLVEQMYGDFKDYSSKVEWSALENCYRIYSGFAKDNRHPVVITTWQSIYKNSPKWFSEFDVVYGDEAHQFKAKSLVTIMNRCFDTKFRIGTTGTLDGTKVNKLVLEGIFGPVYKVTKTKDLMDTGQLASLKVIALMLNHPEESKKIVSKYSYQEEIEYLVLNEKRNKLISQLALSQTGNTLVLFQFVEKHGKVLYNQIKKLSNQKRKIFFVSGETKTEDREAIRRITEKERDAIIVASYGTFSTGINIRNLHNIIFASPSKSRIRTLQSIGRGLRKGDAKVSCNLFDIGDDLTWKSKKNYTMLHMIERIKLYNEEEFKYKLEKINL